MESQIVWMWTVITVVTSTSVGGFFFLNKRLNDLSDHIDTATSFSKQIIQLVSDVHEIKTALVGSFDKKGLIGKVNDLEKQLAEIKG